jgi:hypothetical protein
VGRYNTIWLFGHRPEEMDFLANSLANSFLISPLDKEFVVFYNSCSIIGNHNEINTPSHYLIISDPTPLQVFRKEVRRANNDILWVYFDAMTNKLSDFECPDNEESSASLVLPSIIETHRKKSIILFNFMPYSNSIKSLDAK